MSPQDKGPRLYLSSLQASWPLRLAFLGEGPDLSHQLVHWRLSLQSLRALPGRWRWLFGSGCFRRGSHWAIPARCKGNTHQAVAFLGCPFPGSAYDSSELSPLAGRHCLSLIICLSLPSYSMSSYNSHLKWHLPSCSSPSSNSAGPPRWSNLASTRCLRQRTIGKPSIARCHLNSHCIWSPNCFFSSSAWGSIYRAQCAEHHSRVHFTALDMKKGKAKPTNHWVSTEIFFFEIINRQ